MNTITVNLDNLNELERKQLFSLIETGACLTREKHYRTVEVNDDVYKVGDVISFTLNNGEEVEALAVKEEEDGTIFVLMDCLQDEMNNPSNRENNYMESDLRKILNTEVIKRFPYNIQKEMVSFSNGDMLRLPTEKEIFGENINGEDEGEVEQWVPMKLRRNRIALQGKNGEAEWYWLQNKSTCFTSSFANFYGGGYSYCDGATHSGGVRPVFKIKYH